MEIRDSFLSKIAEEKLYDPLSLRRLFWGLIICFILVIVFFVALYVGSYQISFFEFLRALFRGEGEVAYIVRELRLQRAIGGVLTGASLGVAGAVMQNVLRNPLASPFTLGVSHGAIFGASVGIIVFGFGKLHTVGPQGFTIFKTYPVALFAFLGASSVAVLIYILSRLRDLSPQAIILAGVTIGSLFSSATMFLQYFATDVQVAATVYWTFGDLAKAGIKENKLIFLSFTIGFLFFMGHRWKFNGLLLGEEVAKSLGIETKRLRLLALIVTSLIVAVPTSFLGIIGFVGLMSPHIVRLLVGNDYRYVIPYSALVGAIILLSADILAKVILAPRTLPVGIVTTLVGAPLFLYLLLKRRTI